MASCDCARFVAASALVLGYFGLAAITYLLVAY